MNTHTPGPWMLAWKDEAAMIRVNGSTIYSVADVTAPDYPSGTPRFCLADLQLMAAAPELYEACRLSVLLEDEDVHEFDTRWKDVRKMMRGYPQGRREGGVMKFVQPLTIDRVEFDEMQAAVEFPSERMPKDSCIFDRVVHFPDGIHMAIQVVSPLRPQEESCWTQGVLFLEHPVGRSDKVWHEVGCTDVGDSFDGEYTVEYGGNEYTVVVSPAATEEGRTE